MKAVMLNAVFDNKQITYEHCSLNYHRNFTAFYHYKYGNCYTFNSQMFGNQDQLAVTNRPGPLYGTYVPWYTDTVKLSYQ